MKKRRLRALSGEEKRLIQEDARRHIPLCELAEAYGVTSRTILAVLAEALPPIEPLPEPAAPSAEDAAARALCRDLLALRLDELTPLAALNLLHELQGKVAAHENA